MRNFVDLHLRWPTGGVDELELMLRFAVEIGYYGAGVALKKVLPRSLRRLCSDLGIELVSRIDLRPNSTRELADQLRQVRRCFELVAVICLSKAVARQAAKDHRVDLLEFPSSMQTRARVWFDRQEATLASGSNCAYEINASELLRLGPVAGARLLSIIGREIQNARRNDVPVVVASGAYSRLFMREPRGLAALLELIDVGEEDGLDMISSIPLKIVERNRYKLSKRFVVPGVTMVEDYAR